MSCGLPQGRAADGTAGGRAPAVWPALPALSLAATPGRAAAREAPSCSARAGAAPEQRLGRRPAAPPGSHPDVARADCRQCAVRGRGECLRKVKPGLSRGAEAMLLDALCTEATLSRSWTCGTS